MLFSLGFIMYLSLSNATVIMFFSHWFFGQVGFATAIHLALVIALVNPMNALVIRAQMKLLQNNGVDKDNYTISLVWTAILFPWILLMAGFVFSRFV